MNEPALLPIDAHLPGIVASLRDRGAIALVAEPGAGKTTRVPGAIVDAGIAADGEVVVLEPRRLAVRMAARRVAAERGTTLGGEVGYTIRFEDRSSRETRIRFVTEAVLLRRLAAEPDLPGVTAVVLDEFHERNLVGDLALALLRRLRTRRPELLVVVMSATLDAGSVADFLDCEVVSVRGRTHPIEIEHLERPVDRHLEEEVAAAVRRAVGRNDSGDVLVFLPGAAEIRRAREACAEHADRLGLSIVTLHGDLSPAEQDRAVRPGDRRKIILSTNVAESSVTIEGVTAVVDSGLARVARHDPWSGLPQLVTQKISRASATQRAGRAGRLGPGQCFRLYTRHDHDTRPSHDAPEIARADLSETVLLLRTLGEDPDRFEFFEPPRPAALAAADELLERLGAVEADAITDTGRAMTGLPLHPRLAKLVLAGLETGVGDDAATVAAILGERELRLSHRTRFDERGGPDVETGASDVLARFDAFEAWRHDGADRAAARRHGVDGGTASRIERARRQLLHALRGAVSGAPAPTGPDARDEALLRCILAGFPDRTGRRRAPHGDSVVLAGGGAAQLSAASAVRDAELLVAVEVTGRKPTITIASAIEAEWLLEAFPDRVIDVDEIRFDADRERVVRVRALRYDGLVLDESTSDDVNDERAAQVLAEAAVEIGIGRFCDTVDLERLRRRFSFAAEHGLDASLDDAFVRETLASLCTGLRSFDELQTVGVLPTLKARLGADTLRALERLAPETVSLPGRRSVPIHYELDRPPWLETYLQELFGLTDGPRIAGNRVPVVLHLWAPNGRAVQVTTDLAGFWDRHYPTLRKELMRRYPKHHFPEDPRTAPPTRLKRHL